MASRLLIAYQSLSIVRHDVHGVKRGEPKKTSFVCERDALRTNSRPLRTLHCGDRVFLRKQTGNYPCKWYKVGTVTDALDFDHYAIKLGRPGCITKRNR